MKLKNLKQLKKHIEKCINDSLENEVLETVKKIELSHIKEDVFDVYSPSIYERRSNSGIDDPENIVGDITQNGVLELENVTKFNPEYETENQGLGLVKLIEYGHGESGYFYDYPASDSFTDPRPFIANTKKEIKETKSHVKAIKSGVKRNKIEVK